MAQYGAELAIAKQRLNEASAALEGTQEKMEGLTQDLDNANANFKAGQATIANYEALQRILETGTGDLDTAITRMSNNMQTTATATKDELKTQAQEAEKIFQQIQKDYFDSDKQISEQTLTSAREFRDLAIEELQKAAKESAEEGKNVPAGFAKGMREGTGEVETAARAAAKTAVDASKDELSPGVAQGVGGGFVSGLSGGLQGLDQVRALIAEKFGAIKTAASENMGATSEQARVKMQDVKTIVSQALGNINTSFTEKLGTVLPTVTTKFTGIKTTAQTNMDDVKNGVSAKLENVKTLFSTKMTAAASTASTKMVEIKGHFQNKMEDSKTNVSQKLESIRGSFSEKLGSTASTVSSKMQEIKNSFTSKIQEAHDTISGIIEKIKKLFDISLKLDIKLPHISVSGGEAPYGIGGKGSLPSFSVEWYDKGGIFDRPSIIGVGEKRPEFVGALDDLRQIVREESGAGASAQLLSQMVSLMSQLVDQGMKPITVNQTINANETSYSEQQKAAAYEFKQIARALT
jgi:hypothetical protein